MEKLKPQGFLRLGLMTTVLVMALQEVANFIQIGGLESQIGFALLRLQLFCSLFLFLQRNELQIDVEKLRTALEAVIDAYLRQKRNADL